MRNTKRTKISLLGLGSLTAIGAAWALGPNLGWSDQDGTIVQLPPQHTVASVAVGPRGHFAAASQSSGVDPAGYDPARTDCTYPAGPSVTWDVEDFGSGTINQQAFIDAITAANTHFTTNPDTTVVLKIAAGTWNIGGNGLAGIRVSGLNNTRPSNSGWLVFMGESSQTTTLVFTEMIERGFEGSNVNRLHVCNLHLTRAEETVSQGEVIGFLRGAQWGPDPNPDVYGDQTLAKMGTLDTTGFQSRFLVVRLHSGFPDLNAIYNSTFNQGRYIRKYRYRNDVPYLVQDNNAQTRWEQKQQLPNGDWVMGLGAATALYGVGDTIAIKSKKAGEPFWFAGGNNIVIENVKLTRASRMLFRNGIDNIRISNLSVERMPAINGKVPFLSTSEGGPQLGQPNEGPLTNILVEDSRVLGSGDDGIGAFDVTGLTVRNSWLEDSFARGILLDTTSTTPCIENTLLLHNPLLPENPAFAFGCVTDSSAPGAPASLGATTGTWGISLSWTPPSDSDLGGFIVTRTPAGGTSIDIANGVQASSFIDITAEGGVQYTYTVKAFDTSRNASATSNSVIVTAP